MNKQLVCILLVSIFFVVSACSSKTKQIPGDVISEEFETGAGDDASTAGLENEGDLSVGSLGEGLATGNVVYFNYNSAEILDDSLPLITAAAEALVSNPTSQLRLEGHADERGTREFNLALGERRAQTVRELIMLQGVSGNQIDIVSYGEEKPAVVGSGEGSWQQNRRVELIY